MEGCRHKVIGRYIGRKTRGEGCGKKGIVSTELSRPIGLMRARSKGGPLGYPRSEGAEARIYGAFNNT